MQKIVELLSKENARVKEIQNATGHCYFDSTEVTDMLSYLTAYGKIRQVDNGWILEKATTKSKHDKIRKKFLSDAEEIMKALSNSPKTVDEICHAAKKSKETVELYLPFLADITQLGVITRGPGTYDRTWKLA